ncbi:hypothetical protein AGMMS49975_00450 [Clostridia bacterium]|nr:hypothetical protein AGMMS49975_00450 [Clostridia bacterium]
MFKYEEFQNEIYNRIDWTSVHGEMLDQERRFVNGLILKNKPKNILELGVSQGGGTVVILNAIIDDQSAKLTSVYKMKNRWFDPIVPVAADVYQTFHCDLHNKFKLHTEVDVSEILDELSEIFDFAVIDTSHWHPIETLNFLCVLPYLSDDAIVVFHDISLFYNESYRQRCLATRILISTLASEKILPGDKYTKYISETELVNNICAVKITPELRSNIANTFFALSIPWEDYPAADIANIRKLYTKHYDDKLVKMFDEATKANLAYTISRGQTYSIDKLKESLLTLNGNIIFYGAGTMMSLILELYRVSGLEFDFPIWDINAESIKEIQGHKVYAPDFETQLINCTAVITISNDLISGGVRKKLECIGCICIQGLNELLQLGKIENFWGNIPFPVEFTEAEKDLLLHIERNSLTMVSRERMFATVMSCKYAVSHNVPGDFVECGVWRGGNAILAAGIFKLYGSEKKVWLFDTFEGFLNAGISRGVKDIPNETSENAKKIHQQYYDIANGGNSIDEVVSNFEKIGLLSDNIRFVKGDVLETLSGTQVPETVAVLRLDTDLYESTLRELNVLFPKLSFGGVLMIDDYGHSAGARAATEEFFEHMPNRIWMQYIDHTGRIGIKL